MKNFCWLVCWQLLGLVVCLSSSAYAGSAGEAFSPVTADRILTADKEPHNWMAIGRDYREQFYSPLAQVNLSNVNTLGLAWVFDLDTQRGQQATPLVVDGVMYFSTAWSKVKALDAVTGRPVWQFDPQVDPVKATQACCDVVNRGIALWRDKVYVATLDGRLIALNAKTGAVAWDVLTIPPDTHYTITGAPRAAKGLIFIGNGGAEYGARGYVTAFDAETGKQVWRFYTVPGDPSKPQEQPVLDMAAKTWNGQWWKFGGGGTVWDAIVYDPELDQLYIGVGNGGPHNVAIRSPGGGDNLFVGSIVALDPDTGEYLWHFQATPEDAWDFTSTQPMVLTDLNIAGHPRKVIMQAPKNGFFYVIDRTNGKFISGAPYAPVTWAFGLDENGRPQINPDARYYLTGKPFYGKPGPGGAHSWQPMAYNPETGLVYIPVTESPFVSYAGNQMEGGTNQGKVQPMSAETQAQMAALQKRMREEQAGYLLAWDPVAQKARWRADRSAQFNGGVLTTAGNLVFQGDANGEFAAYQADTGTKVWSFEAYAGIIAAPSTFMIGGEQYISVLQGWGGGYALPAGDLSSLSGRKRNISRVLTFKLNAKQPLAPPPPLPTLSPPPRDGTEQSITVGSKLYLQHCRRCHGGSGISGGTVPDLRYSGMLYSAEAFKTIVHGALLSRGMPSFQNVLEDEDLLNIRHYLIDQANNAVDAAKKN